MSTTALLVEYLVLGAIADIWIFMLLVSLSPLGDAATQTILDVANRLSSILIILLIPITYTLGGMVNFVADALLSNAFQKKDRDTFFGGKTKYKTESATVYQFAPSDTIDRLKYHGHILRVSRGNVLNFTIMLVVMTTWLSRHSTIAYIGITISAVFAAVSFLQWKKRYKNTYSDIHGAYLAITENKRDLKTKKKKTAKKPSSSKS